MILKLVMLFLLASFASSENPHAFIYNGFKDAKPNLTRDGQAEITSNGLLKLTNHTKAQQGHAFYSRRFPFNTTSSFSTTFVFAIIPEYARVSGHGIAFVASTSKDFSGALPNSYLGLFNNTNLGNSSNHVVAVELDTIQSPEFQDIDDNHVGIDINDLTSVKSEPAKYYNNNTGVYRNLTLSSGFSMQVWVEYDGLQKQLNVTLAPINVPKPNIPLLSSSFKSPILSESMYVGFSSSTGSVFASHYILGWSFMMNGEAEALDLKKLPKLPRTKGGNDNLKVLTISLPLAVLCVSVISWFTFYIIRRKKKFEEVLDDWELSYEPHRFSYKDLYIATKGFREKELLGTGGFGRVYKGVLPKSKIEVAVKRVSHESRQGMKEFIAEIVSMGQLRHRNLVQLLGYCRRKGELLLVYDFMPNGSLDKSLFSTKNPLNWHQRFRIIKGVASGLLYLHEEWEQIVIHRDIKASNVLLDGELNGRLGDFGLARLYDHGTDPQTTHLVGTLGYLAPETARRGKATTSTDVFAFGAFLLEVACGRRPIELGQSDENVVLVDWVFSCWNQGDILEASDPKLGADYKRHEMELVLKLGLICSHSIPSLRPNMRHVVQILDGNMPLPDLASFGTNGFCNPFHHGEGFDDILFSYSSSMMNGLSTPASATDSLLSAGR